MTNKEQLTEIATDIKWIKNILSNHLLHHKRVAYILLGITGSAIITLLAFLLK